MFKGSNLNLINFRGISMFKKTGYLVCILGLSFSAAVYAKPATITSNDGTPIDEIVFSGGANFYNASSYPVTYVATDNVTAITPFPDQIKSGSDLKAIYMTTAGKNASIYTWFDQNSTTGNGVEVGISIDNTGALQSTLCESDPKAPIYLVNCDVTVSNGTANMNIFLTDKK